jgi:outer membrane lipoprotein-sorting protein
MQRFLAACAATLVLLTGAASAQTTGRDVLRMVSERLQAITTLQAQFVQINADGSRSQGTLSVKRPGNMRMEYTGDNAPLLIVGGQTIAIYDGPRDQTAEQYPLKRTPLWLVLQPQPQLHTGKGIERVWAENGRYYITTFDPKTPEAGRITFQFQAQPLELEGWVSRAQNGETVTVALSGVREGMELGSSMFSNSTEESRRNDR